MPPVVANTRELMLLLLLAHRTWNLLTIVRLSEMRSDPKCRMNVAGGGEILQSRGGRRCAGYGFHSRVISLTVIESNPYSITLSFPLSSHLHSETGLDRSHGYMELFGDSTQIVTEIPQFP